MLSVIPMLFSFTYFSLAFFILCCCIFGIHLFTFHFFSKMSKVFHSRWSNFLYFQSNKYLSKNTIFDNFRKFYISQAAYSQSKLCQLMFSKTFDRKLKEQKSNIQVIAVHPGVVDTELFNGTMVKITAPWVLKIFCKVSIIFSCFLMYLQLLYNYLYWI